MYSLAEARYHLQNVRRRPDIGVEIADVNELVVWLGSVSDHQLLVRTHKSTHKDL